MSRALSDRDYERLLAFRDGLRRFVHWSEQQALQIGITPAQHQLLLAVRGHQPSAPSIGDIADHLLLRHHSAVGLIDRAEQAGLVERRVDPTNHRQVHLYLTPLGNRRLSRLAAAHYEELERLRHSRLPGAPLTIGDRNQ